MCFWNQFFDLVMKYILVKLGDVFSNGKINETNIFKMTPQQYTQIPKSNKSHSCSTPMHPAIVFLPSVPNSENARSWFLIVFLKKLSLTVWPIWFIDFNQRFRCQPGWPRIHGVWMATRTHTDQPGSGYSPWKAYTYTFFTRKKSLDPRLGYNGWTRGVNVEPL